MRVEGGPGRGWRPERVGAACALRPRSAGGGGVALGGPQSGAEEDVALGDGDPLEREGAHRLDEDDDAGDDRRRPVGIDSPDGAPLVDRQRRQPREQLLDRRKVELVTLDSGVVDTIEPEIHGGEDRRGASDGDAEVGAQARMRHELGVDGPADVLGE